ncbi:RNA-guided endonuclease InsQ/TnpB family protein, partial [Schleiferilactobacillus shenzhenensis]
QQRIKYYQKKMNRKRRANHHHYWTKNYRNIVAKLNRAHQHINDLQQDLLNKFCHFLVTTYDVICIEDLNVNGMKMSKKMAKGVQRSLFRRFRTTITYMAAWAGKTVIVADRWFPSTQRCSRCGYVKTKESYGGKMTLAGDAIHHDHDTYRCYACEAVMNRDENAVENLRQYAAGLPPKTGKPSR